MGWGGQQCTSVHFEMGETESLESKTLIDRVHTSDHVNPHQIIDPRIFAPLAAGDETTTLYKK